MLSEKAAMEEKTLLVGKCHPCEDTRLPFNDRLCAISNDNSLSEEQIHAAINGVSDHGWFQREKPPLFAAAVSSDSPSDKAAAVEAALRAGADPNELDHDFSKTKCGIHARPLDWFINVEIQLDPDINGSIDGMLNNLPAIEVMLRHGADPRLASPYQLSSRSPLSVVESSLSKGDHLEFYQAAWQMFHQVAEALEGECRNDGL